MEQVLQQTTGNNTRQRRNNRTWIAWIFVALLAASAIALRMAVMTSPVRILLASTLIFGLLNVILLYVTLTHAHPRIIWPSVFFVVFFLVWSILGSKPHNTDVLQTYYRNRLHHFNNVKYVRDGESNTGIDCSGLARTALWQAMLKQGLRQANPSMLGPELWKFWFRDLAARDLLEEKYGYTRIIGKADQLAGYDTSKLHIGDMAVTGDGVHVLIYYGDGQWIDAAPDHQRVVISEAPAGTKRGWFNVPVTFVRWWILDK